MISKIILFFIFIFFIHSSIFAQNKKGIFKVKKSNRIFVAADSIMEAFPAYRQYQSMARDSCPCGGNVNSRVIGFATKLSELVKKCDWYNEDIFFTSYEVYLSVPRSSIQMRKAHGDDFPREVKLLLNKNGSKVTFSYIRAYNKKTGKGLKLPTVTFNPLDNN